LALFFEILGFALFVFWLLLIARVVVEFIRSFSRDWHPKGVTVVILEVIMTVTDPPVKLLRRLIPQLTIGAVRSVDHGAAAGRVHRHAAGVRRGGLRTGPGARIWRSQRSPLTVCRGR
jgi:YggT family protein